MEFTETEQNLTSRYTLCRWGFVLTALASTVMTVDAAGQAALLLNRDPRMVAKLLVFVSPEWGLYAGSVLTWCALAGSILLVGRWDEESWRRRTGWFMLLSVAGVGMWVLRHADRFGLSPAEAPHPLLRMLVTIGLRWLWMLRLIDLAGDVAEHLGLAAARKERAAARTALLLAAVFWGLLLLVDLPALLGQPVRMGPRGFRRIFLPFIGFTFTRCAVSFLTTILALAAARECSRMLKDLRDAHLKADVWTH